MHANREQVFPSWILRSPMHTADRFEKGIVALFALVAIVTLAISFPLVSRSNGSIGVN